MYMQRFFPYFTITFITLTLRGGQGQSLEHQQARLISHNNTYRQSHLITMLTLTIDAQDETSLVFKDSHGLQYYIIPPFPYNQEQLHCLKRTPTSPTDFTMLQCQSTYAIGDDFFHLAHFSREKKKYLLHIAFKLTKKTIHGGTHYTDIFNNHYTIKGTNIPETLILTKRSGDQHDGIYRDTNKKEYCLESPRHLKKLTSDQSI
ncbi:MAG: hypothetical protein KJZ77_19080 [Anaerolineales bacterium]|nr:hypothetical protein [Anaerolineales bacterium]